MPLFIADRAQSLVDDLLLLNVLATTDTWIPGQVLLFAVSSLNVGTTDTWILFFPCHLERWNVERSFSLHCCREGTLLSSRSVSRTVVDYEPWTY